MLFCPRQITECGMRSRCDGMEHCVAGSAVAGPLRDRGCLIQYLSGCRRITVLQMVESSGGIGPGQNVRRHGRVICHLQSLPHQVFGRFVVATIHAELCHALQGQYLPSRRSARSVEIEAPVEA
jgi:hypothetical protein